MFVLWSMCSRRWTRIRNWRCIENNLWSSYGLSGVPVILAAGSSNSWSRLVESSNLLLPDGTSWSLSWDISLGIYMQRNTTWPLWPAWYISWCWSWFETVVPQNVHGLWNFAVVPNTVRYISRIYWCILLDTHIIKGWLPASTDSHPTYSVNLETINHLNHILVHGRNRNQHLDHH
jgi:hypothetical protein